MSGKLVLQCSVEFRELRQFCLPTQTRVITTKGNNIHEPRKFRQPKKKKEYSIRPFFHLYKYTYSVKKKRFLVEVEEMKVSLSFFFLFPKFPHPA